MIAVLILLTVTTAVLLATLTGRFIYHELHTSKEETRWPST